MINRRQSRAYYKQFLFYSLIQWQKYLVKIRQFFPVRALTSHTINKIMIKSSSINSLLQAISVLQSHTMTIIILWKFDSSFQWELSLPIQLIKSWSIVINQQLITSNSVLQSHTMTIYTWCFENQVHRTQWDLVSYRLYISSAHQADSGPCTVHLLQPRNDTRISVRHLWKN